jgi:hypothetical protein
MDQRALDRGLPRRRVDLGAEQVGDVKHVAGAFAEGRDMAEAMLRLRFEIAVVSWYSRPGRSRPETSITV